jgi:hypothetical protein
MFDTLFYANKLKAAGVPAKQAEVHAETLGEIFDENEQNLVNKTDLKTVNDNIQMIKIELENKIENLKSDMLLRFASVDVRFAEMKAELIKWVVGISVAQAALIISVLKFLH